MKRKLLSLAVTSLLAFGATAAVSVADPGPNGNNNHGLCTAFFNGQKKGHDKNGEPGPFAALREAAGDSDGDGNPYEEEDIYAFCQAFGIGGNPDHGRFDCEDDPGDTDGDGDEVTCERNDPPGNGKGNG